jgi:mannose-6-phosphate isomerase-like protein (cupin superfamily)
MMRQTLLTLTLLSAPAIAQAPAAPAAMADSPEIRAIVTRMAATMRDSRGFLYHPLLKDGETVAALEYWRAPGRPAIHPDQAEYAIVIDGAGTLVSGGTMIAATTTRPDLVEGSRIQGGTTRRLAKGDVILIPAGVPHWFGITGGRLVLLGMKLPRHGR